LQCIVKKLAGVLEVLFGVGFGGGDVGKGFVEEGDNSTLFFERGYWDASIFDFYL
jgi:hypothetical protein